MALYSNLHDYRFNDTDVDDIRGAAVYGSDDEKLGKVDDIIFSNSSGELRYVVIDSGGWLSSKKFVVPARQLMIREEGDKDFRVSMTKEQVQKLPEYNEKEIESDEKWTDYENRYKTAWADGPILHREGSTHILTPDTVAGEDAGRSHIHVPSPRRIAHDMPRFGATSSADTTDSVSLAGEDDVTPAAIGTHNTIARQIDEPVAEQSGRADGELREDAIGTGRVDRESENARLRAFEERLRRDREEIMRQRARRVA